MKNLDDKKTITVIFKTTYNLNTGKDENIKPGIENKYGIVWRNRAYENVYQAFDELNKYIKAQFDKGAEQLTEEEGSEINKYFRDILVSGSKKVKPTYYKIGSVAYVYSVIDIFIADKK